MLPGNRGQGDITGTFVRCRREPDMRSFQQFIGLDDCGLAAGVGGYHGQQLFLQRFHSLLGTVDGLQHNLLAHGGSEDWWLPSMDWRNHVTTSQQRQTATKDDATYKTGNHEVTCKGCRR